ncbi:bile acid:sodium symporter [Aestuariirhabdus sp. Z084]|uniref:bile acid:sodium symporter family protein n=1 Tax=Aestuariirhabdus haliotis TaxID=2918751 RepID=UPI00201B3E1E|nr:bile acid:sodium symporter [Aestuariirhabdus haliotis]MCL6416974.1 bile acid:sodium symporter [Aestuariirhabdus haliotis]MCL6421019.1 bile acid:sodium symporter [Aestuariirhabdus haliotis]
MQATLLTEILLPLALAIIMFGMGLTLTLSDFTQLWRKPKVIIIGLIGQILLLPCLVLLLLSLFQLPPAMAIGLVIVAACPGGTTSNIISHIAKANLALSVSLTALSTLICIVTTPLLIGFAMQWFDPTLGTDFSVLETTLGLLLITLLPVGAGMAVRHRSVHFALKSEAFFSRFSSLFLLLMIVLIIIQEWDSLLQSLATLLPVTVLLTLAASFMGYGLGWLFNENRTNALTLGIEVGIQNATLAILIALTFLEKTELATAAGVYGLVMYLGAFALVLFTRLTQSSTRAQLAAKSA